MLDIDGSVPTASRATRIVQGCAALLGLAYVGTFFPGTNFLLDNLSNFPAHFAVAFLGCAVLLAWMRSLWWAAGAVAGLALASGQILPWYFGGDAPRHVGEGEAIRVMAANVLLHNRDHDRLLKLAEREDPDVIGLAEVDARWIRALAPLKLRYPHRVEIPSEGYEGLALYSRLPFERVRAASSGDLPFPGIATVMRTPAGDVEFILAHPLPPLDGGLIRRRNAQLLALAQYARASTLPIVVAGDLNVTMWNRGYRPLQKIAGLQNARDGQGLGPTWPAIPPLGVPIDHVLATSSIDLADFRVHGGIGSDHLPVSANFSLQRPP